MKFERIEDHQPALWQGKQNILIRLFTYAKVGLQQVNDYKYIGAAIFGIYYTLKLHHWIWLVVMGVVSVPILILLGRWWLYKGSKASEFVTTQKGSVLGYNQYNIAVRTMELLESIDKKLK